MHELGITRRILEVVLERAADAHAGRITAVHIEIGEESNVSPLAIDLHWPEVSRSTPADGAQLLFAKAADPFAFRLAGIDVEEVVSAALTGCATAR